MGITGNFRTWIKLSQRKRCKGVSKHVPAVSPVMETFACTVEVAVVVVVVVVGAGAGGVVFDCSVSL